MKTNVKHVLISLRGHQHSLNHGGKTITWWRNIIRSNSACNKLSEAFLRSFKPLSDVPAASSLQLWVYLCLLLLLPSSSVSHISHLSPAPRALSETQRPSREEEEVRTNFIVPARKQATTESYTVKILKTVHYALFIKYIVSFLYYGRYIANMAIIRQLRAGWGQHAFEHTI